MSNEIEDRIGEVNELMESNNHLEALKQVRMVKEGMLLNAPPDPSLLGWVMLFEFKCLYVLGEYAAALAQATDLVSSIYTLSSNNSAYRASVCTELSVRCERPVDELIAHGEEAFNQYTHSGNPLFILKSLKMTCYLLRLRDAEDKSEAFARRMIEIGLEQGADVPVIMGFTHLMRGAQRSGRHSELKPLVDELVGRLKSLESSPTRAEMMQEVSLLESANSSFPTNGKMLESFLNSSG